MKTRTTEAIFSGKNALSGIPAALAQFWPGCTALVIADQATWKAAGETVLGFLIESGYPVCKPFIFDVEPRLHADTDRIAELVRFLDTLPPVAPVAVGSGTLNDIVKRAAYEKGLTYMCVPTAPSVDGYTSFGAAVTVNGFKTTLPCSAPKVVVADQEVMASAPYELLAAGYGDLAAKLVSGRDWLIAEALGIETIDPSVWSLSQNKLAERLARPERLRRRDPDAVRAVFDGLCDTGLAMQDQGDSRPASGAEHHISHCLEMRGLQVNGLDVLHGEKVAAGTLLSAAFAEYLFSFTGTEVRQFAAMTHEISAEERECEIRTIFSGSGIRASAVDDAITASLAKLHTGSSRLERLEKICSLWNYLKSRIFLNRPTYVELRTLLFDASCPSFHAIGITPSLASWAMLTAQTIRNRYTVLDLAYELGVLPRIIDIVISKTIAWDV